MALGNEMAVNTILGITIIKEWKLVLSYDPDLVTSRLLRELFQVVFEPTKLSVPPPNVVPAACNTLALPSTPTLFTLSSSCQRDTATQHYHHHVGSTDKCPVFAIEVLHKIH